jgi:catechol 2,3-dioxygenase-like lactoylglutathione lyase family enzyme
MRILDHFVISVSDWERSNAFYSDVVGAEVIGMPRGRWAYRFGNAQINVHGPDASPEPLSAVAIVPGASDICLVWEGPIEEAVEHLRSHDVEVELGPVERQGTGGPGQSVYFRDPDGSLLEFLSYTSG